MWPLPSSRVQALLPPPLRSPLAPPHSPIRTPHSPLSPPHTRDELMKRIPLGPLRYEFSRHTEPRLRIDPEETVVVEMEDALSGQIRTKDDRRDKRTIPYSNPLTGPIWVEGAEPGDTL